ncbi:inhibitor of KinA [Lutibacter sp. Hel_I_33_5]|uniref:5-oxoprolinase subunit PxpB n=1 Tax=Lutibacter sp. Hel_I_33_5 TaxID=1566289 RepID=UPI0011A672AC|nr:5-oxoprolinase subunit PxpB [Lutibacter sp. Hel_I_33_5]TVZ55904.1 inhibitor of KinA [Lutibacter sp. Hel_I_33_5]
MNKYNLTYKSFGDKALLIEWPSIIDENIIEDIIGFDKKVSTNKNVLDTIIAYNSLTIKYIKRVGSLEDTIGDLKEIYSSKTNKNSSKRVCWEIPVCYDLQFGFDLKTISETNNISIEQIINLHTKPTYLIYFLGFQPGFLYLGGLDSKIHIPRKETPRIRVEKGSVGIGGKQTGIYPQDSSGGWNLIGKSPIEFFNVKKESPCFAKAGDKIQFLSVNIDTFYQIEEEVKKGTYQLKSVDI